MAAVQVAISQACTLPWPLEEELRQLAQAACPAVELWWGKVESYLEGRPVAELAELLKRHELAAPVASYQGGLFAQDARAFQEHWSHFLRRLQLAQALGVQVMVVAADAERAPDDSQVAVFLQRLRDAARAAADHGVRLALEFQARSPFGNNLQTAAALVQEADHSHLGICLDAMHFFTGPSKTEDLGYLNAENLFHVQLCDVAGPLREMARDADRILPGEGDFLLGPLIARLEQIGYQGAVSLELMNPQLWQVPVLQLAEVGVTSLRRLLGEAKMPG